MSYLNFYSSGGDPYWGNVLLLLNGASTDTFKFYGQFVGFVFNSIKLENF